MLTEAHTIAASLTKAQRQAVIAARETLMSNDWVIPLRNRWVTKVVLNLRAKGVCEFDFINRDRLTGLGIAVRRILTEQRAGLACPVSGE